MGKSAVLFVNLSKKNAAEKCAHIKTGLEKRKIQTTVFSFEGKPGKPPEGKWDIAFSLGGDGTVLYTARCFAPQGVPVLPISLGTLGFIAEVEDDWFNVFEKWEKNELIISKRCMLKISVKRSSKIAYENICLNDAVISASGIAKLINLDVRINSNKNDIALGSYRCDGLIAATPTGSTAYSMAAGGPILDPEMEAVIINPICPFALSSRPFVLPAKQPLEITVALHQRSGVLLTIDGQDTFNLECSDRIFIQKASKPALLLFADRNAYYSALKTKLSWPGDVNKCGGENA